NPAWAQLRMTARSQHWLAAFALFAGKAANARDFLLGVSAERGLHVQLDPAETLSALEARLQAAVPAAAAQRSDPARHPLFDVSFGECEPQGDLHLRPGGGFFDLTYDANLFTPPMAQRLAAAYAHVLRAPADSAVGSIALAEEAAPAAPSFNWPKHLLLH